MIVISAVEKNKAGEIDICDCLTNYSKFSSLEQCIFITSQFLKVKNTGIVFS